MRRIRMWGLLAVFLLAASAPAAADVAIDAVNFPDAAFRKYVEDNWDKDNNGTLSGAEIAAVKNVGVSGKRIQSLKGIEHFTALGELNCSHNPLTALNVRQNTALEKLFCSHNRLTALDLSKNTKLDALFCDNNYLTSLDVSKNANLKFLICFNNELTALDLSKNTNLEDLSCGNNRLTALDLSKNTKLKWLNCAKNRLMALDLSENTNLKDLTCFENQLTALDLSKNRELWLLHCSYNQLTALDLSKNTKLKRLYCSYNQLTALDLSKNTKLERLYCSYNQLTALDLSKNTKLEKLECQENRLTFLDLQGLNNLSHAANADVNVGGQTRDGLKVSAIGGTYVVDLGAFLPADRFGKVSNLSGETSGDAWLTPQSFSNGKAAFDAKPVKVRYWYDTGKNGHTMYVILTTEPVSPDVPVPPVSPDVPVPPVSPDVPVPPASPDVPVPDYRITVIPSAHGRITLQGSTEALSGDVIVSADSTVTFLVSADAGYEIAYLRDNAVSVDVPAGAARYEHTIPNVRTAHRLEAAFKANSTPPVNPPAPPVNPPAPPSGPDVPPVTPPATPPAPPSSPDMPPVTPPVSPDVPPVTPPVSPDVPAPSPSGPVDIPSSANQWTIHWGAQDAQGNISVTVDVRIESESPLIAGSIRLEVSGIGKVRIVLLLDGQEVSSSGSYPVPARAATQKRAYTLRVMGTVPESARDTARIDAVRYKLEGSDKEEVVRLGEKGGGILLKDMTQKPGTPEPNSGGGCTAGLGSAALLALVPLALRRRR